MDRVKSPKFAVMISILGTIGGMESFPLPHVVYGTSKAAVNFIARILHFEHEKLIADPIHPG